MQERRTTIRVPYLSRTQYCPSDDFLSRDGRLTTLSERGAGMLARGPHQVGGQLTITCSLPGDGDLWTATGIIRWSEARSVNGRWHSLGVEWLPLEETARHRLQQFLYRRTSFAAVRSAASAPRPLRAAPSVRRFALLVVAFIGVPAGILVAGWVMSLESDHRRFEFVIAERNAAIQRLQARETAMQRDLDTAAAYVSTTSSTVDQLDSQAKQFEAEVRQLSEDVARFQDSYGRVVRERAQLIEQVLVLQQERLLREQHANVAEELRLAIREAIASRYVPVPELAPEVVLQEALPLWDAGAPYDLGNHGYVIRDGR